MSAKNPAKMIHFFKLYALTVKKYLTALICESLCTARSQKIIYLRNAKNFPVSKRKRMQQEEEDESGAECLNWTRVLGGNSFD